MVGSPTQVTLEGEFIRLRPLVPGDAEVTFRWRGRQRAVNLNAGADSVAGQAAWIVARPSTEYNFIIELKDGRPVGMLSLVSVDTHHRRAEPGRFLIGEEDDVRGIPAAVEAIKLLYELAFDSLQLLRVYGTIASDNEFMLKWQKFLGMKEEGRLRNHYLINGRFQDAICLGLLVDEYRTTTLPKMRGLIAAARSGS